MRKTQRGVMRTNCMDCLDRTNVVQNLIARRSLLRQLDTLNLASPSAAGEGTVLEVRSRFYVLGTK